MLHLRGLPFRCNEGEIATFLDVNPDTIVNIEIAKGPDRRATGDGYVTLSCQESVAQALTKHKCTMEGYNRYVEIFDSGKSSGPAFGGSGFLPHFRPLRRGPEPNNYPTPGRIFPFLVQVDSP